MTNRHKTNNFSKDKIVWELVFLLLAVSAALTSSSGLILGVLVFCLGNISMFITDSLLKKGGSNCQKK